MKRRLLDRLSGLETEYAIRFTPVDGYQRPSNDIIYKAIEESMTHLVACRHGCGNGPKPRLFLQNGGALGFEACVKDRRLGPVEGSTPECRGPAQLLLFQRAQDELLLRAIPKAQEMLAFKGFPGQVGLLKNCRDARGNLYGAQENYEVEFAGGLRLALYRLGVVMVSLLVLALVPWFWAGFAVFLLVWVMPFAFFSALLGNEELFEQMMGDHGPFQQTVEKVASPFQWAFNGIAVLFHLLIRHTGFKAIKEPLMGHLISRVVLTGCGYLDEDGHFHLSEKADGVTREERLWVNERERPVMETAHFSKRLSNLMDLGLRRVYPLLRARQRLQLAYSDSNLCQYAEYLKLATTGLVLDLAEAGRLRDAPRFADPVAALKSFSADPTLRVSVVDGRGRSWTALELQEYYRAKAEAFVKEHDTPSVEAFRAVQMWGECLSLLRGDRSQLFGKLDWVTKRVLLDRCTSETPAAIKKVDLRYHELGDGYLKALESAGHVPVLVDTEEVKQAQFHPPDDTPARLRSDLIRRSGEELLDVDWEWVRIGPRLRGKVIALRSRGISL